MYGNRCCRLEKMIECRNLLRKKLLNSFLGRYYIDNITAKLIPKSEKFVINAKFIFYFTIQFSSTVQ